MATHRSHDKVDTTYFVTFTCFNWIPLFEIANAYDSVYKWFNIIPTKGNFLLGFVIMPNHLHCLIHIAEHGQKLNTLVANGKRFMAYDIVDKLSNKGYWNLLDRLRDSVPFHERRNGKLHHIFIPSFDAKICYTEDVFCQKLEYIHMNPVQRNHDLVTDFMDYKHSSARFYHLGETSAVPLLHFKEVY